MKSIAVVSGIIENSEGHVLIAQRPPGKHLAGMWEFPGGKAERRETLREALTRELKEELDLDISIVKFFGTFPYNYDWGMIDLSVFCGLAINEPRATEDVQVFRWVDPFQIDFKQIAPADVEPLRLYLVQRWNQLKAP